MKPALLFGHNMHNAILLKKCNSFSTLYHSIHLSIYKLFCMFSKQTNLTATEKEVGIVLYKQQQQQQQISSSHAETTIPLPHGDLTISRLLYLSSLVKNSVENSQMSAHIVHLTVVQ